MFFRLNLAGIMTEWQRILDQLDYAFQPIVNIHSGSIYGFEALLRGCTQVGFPSIDAFFNQAYASGQLCDIDRVLREKAMAKFCAAGWQHKALLFYNLDNRLLESEQTDPSGILASAEKYGMDNHLCLEISEKHEIKYDGAAIDILKHYRQKGLRVAIDDYGTGFSGLQLLYYTDPDFIKIDRFFIQDIATDLKKKLFVSTLVNNAHMMGSVVLAEGVETQREYFECLEIGCDLIQGFFVQKPTTCMEELADQYSHVCGLDRRKQGERTSDKSLLLTGIEYTHPVSITTNAFDVFTLFQSGRSAFIPVINQIGEPVGIVREASFKSFAYSRFGRELLQNKAARSKLTDFMDPLPKVDIHSTAEHILEIFNLNKGVEAILITDQMRYAGHLSARSLLSVLHEKNLSIARDQNPLTRLPGNNVIFEFVSEALESCADCYTLVYFDFDKFKPYNDRYGFRQGDRVILRFAEILREFGQATLTAHIGGDDFFLGFRRCDRNLVYRNVHECVERFCLDVEHFYDTEDLAKGYILSKDRSGFEKEFPLMTLSAVIIEMPCGRIQHSHDYISKVMASGKKIAKQTDNHMYFEILDSAEVFAC